MAAAKSADWAAARLLVEPDTYGSTEWLEHYQDHPDVLTKMLGDLYRVYKSEQAKANGTANPAGGRRKGHINGNLDELWEIITPRFAVVPLRQAVDDIRKVSLRHLALKVGMDRRSLTRILDGELPAERSDLERVAAALRVHPSYFAEWRAMVVQDFLGQLFAAKPNLSIQVLRSLQPWA